MKHKLTALAVLAAVAFGFGLSSATAAPAAAGAGSAALIHATAPDGSQVQLANHRGDGRWHRRQYRDDRWRPRGHRYRGPSSGFYFEFNVPSYRYVQPPRYVVPPRVVRPASAHVRWCHARYKSYRAWDNTWQPYHGPRRQCASPYGY